MLTCKVQLSKSPDYSKTVKLPKFTAINLGDFDAKVKTIREKFYLFPYVFAVAKEN